MSSPLRNPNIDYERGWFSTVFQIAFSMHCVNWYNQYAIKQVASVWAGSIRPGGRIETLLKAIKGKEES